VLRGKVLVYIDTASEAEKIRERTLQSLTALPILLIQIPRDAFVGLSRCRSPRLSEAVTVVEVQRHEVQRRSEETTSVSECYPVPSMAIRRGRKLDDRWARDLHVPDVGRAILSNGDVCTRHTISAW